EKPKPIKKPEPIKKPLTTKVKKAREVAKKSGLLAVQSDLAELKTVVDVAALKKKVAPSKQATIAAKASGPASSEVLKRSSGISTEALAAPAETVSLSARENEVLDATEDEISLALAEEEAASGMLSRSEENIRLVAESLKSAFNKLYVRELRKDPFLEGLLMLEVIIEPSGEVSFCRIVSSELNHPVLENKIVKRMYLADFGVENVMQTTINIPFPFRPN
ncbi:AgmX/PglI C-terminal domain-containing protein, partial [Oleiphilus sp. HI0086]